MRSAERLKAVLERLADHPFYAGRLPGSVADGAEFAGLGPDDLMVALDKAMADRHPAGSRP